jgi:signal transduction histidine kinase
MQAQRAIDDGDMVKAQSLMAQARSTLDAPLDVPVTDETTANEVVNAIVLAWSGLIDITATCEVSDALPPWTVRSIENVLLEGVGNAVRHGHAQQVQLDVRQDGPHIQITVVDDGVGVRASQPGLGSAMFNEIAPGAWSLTAGAEGGSVLTLTLTAG